MCQIKQLRFTKSFAYTGSKHREVNVWFEMILKKIEHKQCKHYQIDHNSKITDDHNCSKEIRLEFDKSIKKNDKNTNTVYCSKIKTYKLEQKFLNLPCF